MHNNCLSSLSVSLWWLSKRYQVYDAYKKCKKAASTDYALQAAYVLSSQVQLNVDLKLHLVFCHR